jgi:hypothetical protein
MTTLPPELLEAYRRTTYRVYQPPINIRIGQPCPELDALLEQHGVDSWAYITAWNPYSQEMTDEENAQRHKELQAMTSAYQTFEGEGVGEDPAWTPERSLLILGVPVEEAIRIGKYFEQNAIVLGKESAPADILVL